MVRNKYHTSNEGVISLVRQSQITSKTYLHNCPLLFPIDTTCNIETFLYVSIIIRRPLVWSDVSNCGYSEYATGPKPTRPDQPNNGTDKVAAAIYSQLASQTNKLRLVSHSSSRQQPTASAAVWQLRWVWQQTNSRPNCYYCWKLSVGGRGLTSKRWYGVASACRYICWTPVCL